LTSWGSRERLSIEREPIERKAGMGRLPVSIAAVVLWFYAGVGLLFGLALMGVWVIGVPLVIGALSVGIGAYLRRPRPGWASILLVVGGIVVGGTLGVFGEAVSYVEGQDEHYVAAFIFGVIFLGFLPIIAGLWLVLERMERAWRARRGSAESIE
jgi:hypothetical protein